MSTHASSPGSTPGPEGGISLLEVMVAMLIFTIGALAAVQQALTARQQARAGEYITEAAAAAQYQMETLRSLPYDSLVSGSDSVWGFPLTWTVSGATPKIAVLTVERPTVLPGQTVVDTFVTYVDRILTDGSGVVVAGKGKGK